jgi:methionyl-tRNA synthetase
MLHAGGLSLPHRIHIHGFLTVNGEKMSKTKGTFILASTYRKHLDPAHLRYYYASKLGPGNEDLDLNLEEFAARVNSDLVGKVVNLASRTARFVEAVGLCAEYPEDAGLFAEGARVGTEIAEAYEACDTARAMRLVRALADRANEYVDRMEPWKLAKTPGQQETMQAVCTIALNLYRQIVVYLAPVLPRLAEQSGELLQAPITSFAQSQTPLVGTAVGTFKHLMQRVDPGAVAAMVADSATPESAPNDAAALGGEPLAPECTIEDFTKVDLRIARIVEAKDVPGAKKLVELVVSLGGSERRTLFAGIKAAYRPEALVGRLVVVVANLRPRQMKFGTSQGMVCAAGPGEAAVFLLGVDSGALPGQRVH